jgi:hypothetical protein
MMMSSSSVDLWGENSIFAQARRLREQYEAAERLHMAMAIRINALAEAGTTEPEAMRALLDEFPTAGVGDWSEAFLKAPDTENRGPGFKVQMLADMLMDGPDCQPALNIDPRSASKIDPPAWWLVPVVHRGDPRDAECPSRG